MRHRRAPKSASRQSECQCASVTRRDIYCLLPLASGHQQPSQLSVSRPMAVAGCAALRSSPQSISGPLAFDLRLRSGARIHHLAQIATTDRPPALQRRRACTSSLERVAVAYYTTNDLPSCLHVQGGAQPTPKWVWHRQLASSSCKQQRSPRATGPMWSAPISSQIKVTVRKQSFLTAYNISSQDG